MADLAAATGGTFFQNSNDLEAGFKSVMKVPEYVYVLELSLDGVKPDGNYHRLKVKVNRTGVQVQAPPVTSCPILRKAASRSFLARRQRCGSGELVT